MLAEGRFDTAQLMAAEVSFEKLIGWYAEAISAQDSELALDERDVARLRIPTNVYGVT